MVRLTDMAPSDAEHLLEKPCPRLPETAWVSPIPLNTRRFALITTAGIGRHDDAGFDFRTNEYRVISNEDDAGDLVMTHNSVNFDRSGFQQDLNVAFPVDRFRELAERGTIGSLANFHYSFMGAYTEPLDFEPGARACAAKLKADGVDSVFITPV